MVHTGRILESQLFRLYLEILGTESGTFGVQSKLQYLQGCHVGNVVVAWLLNGIKDQRKPVGKPKVKYSNTPVFFSTWSSSSI